MDDTVMRLLEFGGFIALLVVVFWLVRRLATTWTWGQRKLALYGLMFGTLLIIQLGSSALIGAAIAAFLSILAAPEPGSTTKDTLKGAVIFVLRIAGAILIPMSITLAILGLIWLTNPR